VEQFQAQAGDDLTQMFQWFQDFGCESHLLRISLDSFISSLLTCSIRCEMIDYGGKDTKPSQEVLSPNAKIQKWKEFVKESDWTKVLNGSG
jgi:hypothetical protein